MISILIILLILNYIVCGILAYGIILAYQCEEYYELNLYRESLAFSIFCGLSGFIGFIVVFLLTGFGRHGWRFR